MSSVALSRDSYFPIYNYREEAFSQEAKSMIDAQREVNDNLQITYTYKDILIQSSIEKSTGYVSAEYISRNTEIDIKEIEQFLLNNKKFAKSFMKGSKGQDIYFVKKPYSILKDIWKSFRHLNSIKY